MGIKINEGSRDISFAFLGNIEVDPRGLDCDINFTAVQQYYFWRSDRYLVLGGGSCTFLSVGPTVRYFNSTLPNSFFCFSGPVGNFGPTTNPGPGNYVDGMGGQWGSRCGTVSGQGPGVCSLGPTTNERKAVLITAQEIGLVNGTTFDLYSNVNNYSTPFESGVSKTNLLNGYITTLVPGAALYIKIKSSTGVCGLQPEDNNGVLITGVI